MVMHHGDGSSVFRNQGIWTDSELKFRYSMTLSYDPASRLSTVGISQCTLGKATTGSKIVVCNGVLDKELDDREQAYK
jgi:hypothetical protein